MTLSRRTASRLQHLVPELHCLKLLWGKTHVHAVHALLWTAVFARHCGTSAGQTQSLHALQDKPKSIIQNATRSRSTVGYLMRRADCRDSQKSPLSAE
jgi:hypothetical protein